MRLSVKGLWLAIMLLLSVSCAVPPQGGAAPASSDSSTAPTTDQAKTAQDTIVAAVANDPTTWDYDFVQGDLVGLSLVKNVDPFLIEVFPFGDARCEKQISTDAKCE